VKYFIDVNDETREVVITERAGQVHISVDGEPLELSYEEADQHGQVIVLSGGRSYGLSIEGNGEEVHVTLAGHQYRLAIEDEREHAARAAERERLGGGGDVTAVMPGVVVDVLVQPGDEVAEGQPLLILEAMKMQNEIAAPAAAIVEVVQVEAGTAVAAGAKLVTLRAASEE